jgi:hypothetical protein
MNVSTPALWVSQVLCSGFLGVLFLQSGLDKVLDWSGNKAWLSGHFAKSPLARVTGVLLFAITMMELGAGVFSAAGCLAVVLSRSTFIALMGAALSGLSIVSLFFGQRLAKDYAGAAGLVPYFLVTVASVLLLGASA